MHCPRCGRQGRRLPNYYTIKANRKIPIAYCSYCEIEYLVAMRDCAQMPVPNQLCWSGHLEVRR